MSPDAIRSGAAYFGRCFPHKLREMARLFAETSGWVVVILVAFIRPCVDGCCHVWEPLCKVLAIGTALAHQSVL